MQQRLHDKNAQLERVSSPPQKAGEVVQKLQEELTTTQQQLHELNNHKSSPLLGKKAGVPSLAGNYRKTNVLEKKSLPNLNFTNQRVKPSKSTSQIRAKDMPLQRRATPINLKHLNESKSLSSAYSTGHVKSSNKAEKSMGLRSVSSKKLKPVRHHQQSSSEIPHYSGLRSPPNQD